MAALPLAGALAALLGERHAVTAVTRGHRRHNGDGNPNDNGNGNGNGDNRQGKRKGSDGGGGGRTCPEASYCDDDKLIYCLGINGAQGIQVETWNGECFCMANDTCGNPCQTNGDCCKSKDDCTRGTCVRSTGCCPGENVCANAAF